MTVKRRKIQYTRFRVGDRIRCINNEQRTVLKLNGHYTITEIDWGQLRLKGLNGLFHHVRFILVKEAAHGKGSSAGTTREKRGR